MTEQPPTGQPLSIPQRLAIVYERLDQLPPAKTADEALEQLATTLEEVEDQYSGVPKVDNPGLNTGGRMYPPRADFTERLPDGGLRAKTKGNIVDIGADGSTTILSRREEGKVMYHRAGAGQALDPGLEKVRDLSATAYPKTVGSPRAAGPQDQPARPGGHQAQERDDPGKGR